MLDCFFFCLPSKPKLKCENDTKKPLLITNNNHDHDSENTPTATIVLFLTSWLRGRRLCYLILALCLPLVIPIVCISVPIICGVEIWFFIRRCGRKWSRLRSGPPVAVEGEGEEVAVAVVVEVSLLERYLDDQLGLAIEVACECESNESDYFYSSRSDLLC
uniref:Transmembrane protein n=1 Tax=Tanacetum cinerariifolium TaxID=118510 RepID=A0A6L2J0U2_TANCI|nr:hypothetical protein [Tanacetum cinerariifolium]